MLKRIFDSSDDNTEENSRNIYDDSSRNIRMPRRAKAFCYKAMLNKDDDDDYSIDFDDPQHDSDNDPDFKSGESDSESSENENNNVKDKYDDDELSDDRFSVISNMTDFQATLDMLNNSLGDTVTLTKNESLEFFSQTSRKTLSQRKLSAECLSIYGNAQQLLWEKKYDAATELCGRIIKEHSTFWGSYHILGQIYEERGDLRKANELYYTSVLCNPKDIDKWITCIENTKLLDGLEKAIEAAKLAVSRTQNQTLRFMLVDLLQEGGYEKEAYKKKLIYLHHSPFDKNNADTEAEELIFMSEKFESWKDEIRASECLEVLNNKYPSNLTNERLISLLRILIKLKRYNKVLNVSKNIKGVKINLTDLTDSSNLIWIDDINIDEERRHDIIYAILMSILHLKMPSVVLHRSFKEYLNQLVSLETYYVNILIKLFDLGYYGMVSENAKSIYDKCEDKLLLLKILGKSQEKLDLTDEALQTYDFIINEVNGKDVAVWELKANLLYRLKREQEAINVLEESQKFVSDQSEEVIGGRFTRRIKPTKDSAQLLYKLCLLLHKESRMEEYIKIGWRYIFIDSYDYFKVNKMKLFCEEMSFVKDNFREVTNNILECISMIANGKSSEKSIMFISSHAHLPYENQAWEVIEKLLDLLISSYQENMRYIEVIAQWGLVLQKFVGWNVARREKLSSIYISSALINRINNIDIRRQPSTSMILSELRNWKTKYIDKAQYWNMFNIYCRLSDTINGRYVLRSIAHARDCYFLDIINAGIVTSNGIKLSLAVNSKVYFQHPENAQICLQLSITYLNAAISRVYKDDMRPIELAIYFMHQYRRLRGDCQEAWYNMGRFFHRISFYQYAIACYDKCLETPPVGATSREKMLTDLSKEAAFNLVLIYKERHNKPMSAYLIQKYLTI